MTNKELNILKAYCAWLNAHRAPTDDFTFAPEMFMVENSGYLTQRGHAILTTDYNLEVYGAYYGDDGGESTLICFFHTDAWVTAHPRADETDMPWFIYQEFDTYTTLVMYEGKISTMEVMPIEANGHMTVDEMRLLSRLMTRWLSHITDATPNDHPLIRAANMTLALVQSTLEHQEK